MSGNKCQDFGVHVIVLSSQLSFGSRTNVFIFRDRVSKTELSHVD